MHPTGWLDQRADGRIGRGVISIFVMITLAAVVVVNLPESLVRADALRVAGPYLRATGLDQGWGVFAPPRKVTLGLYARVELESGRMERWELPLRDPLLGGYTDYRWRKYLEYATNEANSGLWPDLARYVARHVKGGTPTRVTLVRVVRPIRFPRTDAASHGASEERVLFTLDLSGRPE